MPKQELEAGDYFGPIVVGVIFAVVLAVSSVVINFFCINKKDDITAFERWGVKRNLRIGPHRLSVVRRVIDKEVTIED